MRHIVLTSQPDEALAERWNAFLADADFATHYVTPNYFIDPYAGGNRFAVLAIDDADEIQAVVTGSYQGEAVTSGMFSRPQSAFRRGAEHSEAAAALLSGMREVGGGRGLIELYTWQPMQHFAALGMTARPSADATSIVVLDLSAGPDALFARFSQTRRNEIRKALRQKLVEVKQLETEDELTQMHQIHCEWNARKGNAAHSVERMRTAVAQTGNRRVFIAKVGERVVAGSFYRFCPGGVVEYAANFSLPEYQRLRPNDLIGWHAIEWACREGFRLFSMGGAHLFLRRFGGDIVTTYRYRLDETRFRLHSLRETARDLGSHAYRRLPAHLRETVRLVRAK